MYIFFRIRIIADVHFRRGGGVGCLRKECSLQTSEKDDEYG